MSKYLSQEELKLLCDASQRVKDIRNGIYSSLEVDLFDTDVLSSILALSDIRQYDARYEINFSRNGEDARSGPILIEQKTTSITKPTKKTRFMFHALGDLHHPRYIFVVRSTYTLNIHRIYDFMDPSNRQVLISSLEEQRAKYLQSPKKFNGIYIAEKFLLSRLKFNTFTINGVTVARDHDGTLHPTVSDSLYEVS